MRKRTRAAKKLPTTDSEPQTSIQPQPQPFFDLDPQIEHSNSQLSLTLSTSYHPKQIHCREHEKQVITKFIKGCLASHAEEGSRVLYISGVPGIGKTVATMEIIGKIKRNISARKVTFRYINAMSLPTPGKIYTLINKQLYKPQKNDIAKNPAMGLQSKLQQDKKIKILIIDEIDHLYTKNQAILYNLFEWANIQGTKFCMIIIANTMDFPERLQPKLVSRMGNNRLVFKPYCQSEVKKIIEDRLMKSNRFTKDAIQYACKKMSTFTSDVRKLLDILTRALQTKQSGKIDMEDMSKVWKIYAQESGELWQEYLPQFYREIMNIIKDHGGVSTQYRIHERMCVKGRFTVGEILLAMREMEEMAILGLKRRNWDGMAVMEATLKKI